MTDTQVTTGPVEVLCGANQQMVGLGEGEQLTVGDIRNQLTDVLNIAPNALAVIGDSTVGEDRVLAPYETLQFIKQSGEKG